MWTKVVARLIAEKDRQLAAGSVDAALERAEWHTCDRSGFLKG
jgi:hypothetical protein